MLTTCFQSKTIIKNSLPNFNIEFEMKSGISCSYFEVTACSAEVLGVECIGKRVMYIDNYCVPHLKNRA